MDPMIVSLIFQGLRLVAQLSTQGYRARQALSELEAFLVQLHQENRLPTYEEMVHYTSATADLDKHFRANLERLKTIVAEPVSVPIEELPVRPAEADAVFGSDKFDDTLGEV
jgi:hypothetical protein